MRQASAWVVMARCYVALWVAVLVALVLAPAEAEPPACEATVFGCMSGRGAITFAITIAGAPLTIGAVVIGSCWIVAWQALLQERARPLAVGLSAALVGVVVPIGIGLMALRG